MVYTRTTQQWQWLIGKLWHGYYRSQDLSDRHNPYLILIETIESKLHVGNPMEKPISVHLPKFIIEEVELYYADAIRRSGTLGRQPQHEVLPTLLEDIPGARTNDSRRTVRLSGVPQESAPIRRDDIVSGLEGRQGWFRANHWLRDEI